MSQQRTMSQAADMMINEVDTFSLLQLSSMALDPYSNVAKQQADDSTTRTCASSCMSTASSSSQLSGWGSVVSRKSYACLRTLEAESQRAIAQQQQVRQIQQTPEIGDTWGYFVDTPGV